MTRDEILDEARGWLYPVTRWVHQASCRNVGADCIGYIAGVAAACGSADAIRFLATPEWRRYGREPKPEFMFSVCDELMDRIDIAYALPADVAVFECGKHPMHFAFLAGDRLLHSWLVARRVCEHQFDAGWHARMLRIYRIRGIY